jgi:hypothetical protein
MLPVDSRRELATKGWRRELTHLREIPDFAQENTEMSYGKNFVLRSIDRQIVGLGETKELRLMEKIQIPVVPPCSTPRVAAMERVFGSDGDSCPAGNTDKSDSLQSRSSPESPRQDLPLRRLTASALHSPLRCCTTI